MNLVAWSGGLDSTYLLWRLAQKGQVHAHHIFVLSHSHSQRKRWDCERDAIAALKENLAGFSIKFSEQILNSSERQPPGDIVWTTAATARFILSGLIRSPENYQWGSREEETERGVPQRRERAKQIWRDIFTTARATPPPIVCPSIHITRKECWDALPQEIRELTITCRMPTVKEGYWEQCGRCHTCQQQKAAGVPLRRNLPASTETANG